MRKTFVIIGNQRKVVKVVKPLLSNKIVSNQKITLVEGEEITKTDQAKVLNNFSSNTIKNLENPQYNQADTICQNIKDPVIKTIIKYSNPSRVIAIKERCTNSRFSFSFIEKKYILKEIKNLQIKKAPQDSDIPTKLIKNNSDLFVYFIFANLNDFIAQTTFPFLLKLANITPVDITPVVTFVGA